jgi:hypothetical protein
MDQCSDRHDIPSALRAHLTNRPGHDLALGIDTLRGLHSAHRPAARLISIPRRGPNSRQRHADRYPLGDSQTLHYQRYSEASGTSFEFWKPGRPLAAFFDVPVSGRSRSCRGISATPKRNGTAGAGRSSCTTDCFPRRGRAQPRSTVSIRPRSAHGCWPPSLAESTHFGERLFVSTHVGTRISDQRLCTYFVLAEGATALGAQDK